MSEQATETTPSTRNFYRPDYEKVADILRRARHNMTPSQVSAIGDGAAEYFVTLFTADNPNFDPAPFIRATLRRIETVDNAEYVAWAIENDLDPNAPTLNEDAFYAAKAAAQYADSEEDDEDESDDDTEN